MDEIEWDILTITLVAGYLILVTFLTILGGLQALTL